MEGEILVQHGTHSRWFEPSGIFMCKEGPFLGWGGFLSRGLLCSKVSLKWPSFVQKWNWFGEFWVKALSKGVFLVLFVKISSLAIVWNRWGWPRPGGYGFQNDGEALVWSFSWGPWNDPWKVQVLRFMADLVHQNIWGWCLGICIQTSGTLDESHTHTDGKPLPSAVTGRLDRGWPWYLGTDFDAWEWKSGMEGRPMVRGEGGRPGGNNWDSFLLPLLIRGPVPGIVRNITFHEGKEGLSPKHLSLEGIRKLTCMAFPRFVGFAQSSDEARCYAYGCTIGGLENVLRP